MTHNILIFRPTEHQHGDSSKDSSLKRSRSSLLLPIELPNDTDTKDSISVSIDAETINSEDKGIEQKLEKKYYVTQPSKDVYPATRHIKYTNLDIPKTYDTDKTNKNYDAITTSKITTIPSTLPMSKDNDVQRVPIVKMSCGDDAAEITGNLCFKDPVGNRSNSKQLEINTLKTVMTENDIEKQRRVAILSRDMSFSTPDFVTYFPRARARTISERAEENDMVSRSS